jgi:tRNA-modifying protein YgfZ
MPHLGGVTWFAQLPGRAVLAVSGNDRVSFLNGLVSNDVAQVAPARAVWAALLTPQGKYLTDFFIYADSERLLLECEASQRDMLAQKLSRFRLRAQVAVEPADFSTYAGWDGAPPAISAAVAAPDPRLPGAGWRVLTTQAPATNATYEEWDRHRLALGLPDGTRDLETEKTVLLEAGFDELNGISWTKGCYMGQELTARTRYRGLLKRRLLPVAATGNVPAHGTAVFAGGREVGEMRSGRGQIGLALLRLDALGEALTAGGQSLRVEVPAWARLSAG